RVLTADGVISLIGCLLGNPFINAVYIGHPGWKAMGGRIGYSAATGVIVAALCWFGVIALLLALVPVVAISPILLYIGMLIAWGAAGLGFEVAGISAAGLGHALSSFGFSLPIPAFDHVFDGFKFLGVILITAIPFGIYDLVEAMDNVESAEAAGDHYPMTRVLTADGVVSLIGCLMGNPFINAVYIGHPGWKTMGGRIGYSAATGLIVALLCWFGVIALLLALVPVVAISPILLYIGMLIGAQAFQTTPSTHAPAIVLGILPHLAAWTKTLIDGALGAAGVHMSPDLVHNMAMGGVLYEGLTVFGSGAILVGLVLAAISVFIIERKFEMAAAFALAGAVLSFLGFMHSETLGFNVAPMVSLAYVIMAAFLYLCAKANVVSFGIAPEPIASDAPSAHPAE
ncbi:MAG TPA: hypothetical protein VGC31_05455, partial [Paenirhodobacter sp.]